GARTASGAWTPEPSGWSGAATASAGLTGLTPGSAYHYRLVVTSAAGRTAGADAVVTTSPAIAPAAGILPAADLAPHSATLAGSVDGRDLAATYHFEYGTTTAYGSSTDRLTLP